jgi:biopolymer transport protein ExbD
LSNWDVFHGDRLELERGLTTSAIREAMARGEVCDDDLVRPAGTTVAWTRLADMPPLLEAAEPPLPPNLQTPAPAASASAPANSPGAGVAPGDFEFQVDESRPIRVLPPAEVPKVPAPNWLEMQAEPDDVAFPVIKDEPAEPKRTPAGSRTPEVPASGGWVWAERDEEDREEEDKDFVGEPDAVEELGVDDDLESLDDESDVAADVRFAIVDELVETNRSSRVALPVVSSSDWDDAGAGALAEVPEEDEFSLSRSGPMTVEELDLAPMVDVAFQLVLFFMVAAQTVLYKTLEIPKPSTDQPPAAVAQGRSRTLDDLKDDYILVEIDPSGAMKIDRQPVSADMATLVERLRSAREATGRKAMLLSADFATPHRSAVLSYDAANEIGLGIVIARPTSPQGPAPRLLPGQPPAAAAAKPAPAANSVPN